MPCRVLTWPRYVLSTTHLHEFKSADKAQAPVMSLYLPDQKLGSHSTEGGSSNKFILKGRQTGTMHRGHTWVFRAESHDTMMAWYEDIKALTEKSPEERSQFVRTHSRSLSRSSRRSVSSDGLVDEDDEEPFSANHIDMTPEPRDESVPRRPEPGGRFPSDLQVNAQRGLQAPHSPSSVSSGHQDYSAAAAEASAVAAALPPAAYAAGENGEQERLDPENHMGYGGTVRTPMEDMPSQAAIASQQAHHDGINPYTSEPVTQSTHGHDEYFAAAAIGSQGRHDAVAEDTAKGEVSDIPELASEAPGHHADGGSSAVKSDAAGTSVSSSSAPQAENYVNGTAPGAVLLTASNVPRSEAQREATLQDVPETETADHTTSKAAVVGETRSAQRPVDNRTDSLVTISNLPIPGKFPKGSSITSP